MLTLTYLLLFLKVSSIEEPRGLVCKLCMLVQEKFFNRSYDHLPGIENFVVRACEIYEEAPFCKYFVGGLGNILLQNRIKYFLDNNIFCSHLLDVCDNTTVEYDFEAYRKNLFVKYPPVSQKGKKLRVYKEFNILTLNDIHIQTDYEAKTQKNCKDPGGCCSKHAGRAWRKEDQAGYWGSPGASCDIPSRTFDATINFIKKNITTPTFVTVLGDNFGHNYFRTDPNQIIDVNQYVYSSLRSNFTESHILPVLGNHECNPIDALNLTDPNDYVYKNIFPTYKSSINEDQIQQLAAKGFYTATFEEYGVKFISINSQMYDAFNGYMTRNSTDPLLFFENFADELYSSELSHQKVIILSHIPIADTFSIKEFGINMKSIFERFQDTIVAFFSGHTHADSLIFIKDHADEIVSINYLSPSLTTSSSYNPSFRVYQFDNAKLTNYHQYTLDLDYYNELANKDDFDFGYSLSYEFRTEYKIESWGSPQDFRNLRNKIFTDPVFTEKYIKNFATSEKAIIPLVTKDYALCSTLDSVDKYEECVTTKLPYKWDWRVNLLFRRLFIGNWLVQKEDNM